MVGVLIIVALFVVVVENDVTVVVAVDVDVDNILSAAVFAVDVVIDIGLTVSILTKFSLYSLILGDRNVTLYES